MKLSLAILVFLAPTLLFGLSDPPQTVDHVDLDRYLGKWYEIAAIPQTFQKNCKDSEALYKRSKLAENFIVVVNKCKGKKTNRPKRARGLAWVVDKDTNAKLKVTFYPPFIGDYWILELDSEYRYAVVGDPERESLWILSRTPTMEKELVDELMTKIKEKHGYDTAQIKVHDAKTTE